MCKCMPKIVFLASQNDLNCQIYDSAASFWPPGVTQKLSAREFIIFDHKPPHPTTPVAIFGKIQPHL